MSISKLLKLETKSIKETTRLLKLETDKNKRTIIFHNWIKQSHDDIKLFYRINFRLPHSLFNVSCNFFDVANIQNIDWFGIFESNDTGLWDWQKNQLEENLPD